MSFPVFLGKRESGVHLANHDPFVRHDKYYFKDGNITFLVDDTLYCVHRYFFCRDSTYFSTRLDQLGIREHEFLAIIISLGDVERKDFEAFLSVIYPDDFEEHGLSYEQWKSVLHLSSRWGFASLRRLALKSIRPPTPFDQLLLARAYSVDHWALPALSALCERTVPLTLNEARQMNIEDVVLITTVREDIRPHSLQVDSDEIPHCIEAAQAGMDAVATGQGAGVFRFEGARGATPTSPSSTSNGTERSARSTADVAKASNTGAEGENDDDDAKTAVALSPVEVRGGAKREEGTTRHTSAWGKILVVPSPTVSLAHHVQEWGTPADPLEAHNPPLRSMICVNSPRRSSAVPAPAKPVRGDLSDSDSDEDWGRTRTTFHDTIT